MCCLCIPAAQEDCLRRSGKRKNKENEEVCDHFLVFLLQVARLEQVEMIPQESSCALDVRHHGIVEAAIRP